MAMTYVHRDPAARVLVFSLRNMLPLPARCVNYEMEDVVASLDRVDVVAPLHSAGPPRVVQRALWGKVGRRLSLARSIPQLGALSPLDRDYDLLFITCQNPSDLYFLGPLAPWRARCRKAVVYVDELWAHTVPSRPGEMAMLAQFDHIVVGQEAPIAAVQAATGVATSYLAVGVDLLRFSPGARPQPRVIDVFNMGRRSPVTHTALLRLAEERGLLYLFDTISGKGRVYDVREHRAQLASTIKRTRYFITNVAKITAPEETRGQQEVGFRFFEGAAAGAVLIGEAPRCPSFDEHFGWEDAVIHMPYGTADPAAIIDALDADPQRVEAIRRRNISQSLRRHDWAHRWTSILTLAGLQPDARVGERLDRLARLAAELDVAPAVKNGGAHPGPIAWRRAAC
jgi:hypothetical protein